MTWIGSVLPALIGSVAGAVVGYFLKSVVGGMLLGVVIAAVATVLVKFFITNTLADADASAGDNISVQVAGAVLCAVAQAIRNTRDKLWERLNEFWRENGQLIRHSALLLGAGCFIILIILGVRSWSAADP